MLDTFTTSEAAEILEMCVGTVAKNFDAGKLKGFRVPGSKDRRIFESSLREVLGELGIAPDRIDEFGKVPKILAISQNEKLLQAIDKGNKVFVAQNTFEAGFHAGKKNLDGVIADFSTDGIRKEDLLRICAKLRQKFERIAAIGIFLRSPVQNDDIDESFHGPYDPQLVALRLQRVMNRKHLHNGHKGEKAVDL